jgi:hypothetical protein
MLDLPSFAYGTGVRFALGGVAFTMLPARDVRWELPPECVQFAGDAAVQPTIAQLTCEVELDRALAAPPACGISIEHDKDVTRVASVELRAELIQLGPNRYHARARIAPDGAGSLALGLAAAIIERHGGLCLHAAAIELDGRAVLFIGPSGAGKSTAVLLARGAPVFAYDRVAVSCQNGAFHAFGLPAGSRVPGARSAHLALPLGAVFRIRRGEGVPRILPLTAARAMFALRESTEVTDPSQLAEQRRLDAATALLARVPVAELHTVLGRSHLSLLKLPGDQHATA